MKDHTALISKRSIGILIIFFTIMMLIGTFLDFPISRGLYNEKNLFGILGAAYGEYPAALGLAASGALLWIGHCKTSKLKAVLQCLGGSFLILSGTLMLMVLPTHYMSGFPVVLMGIGFLCSVAIVIFLYRLCKDTDRKMIMRVAIILFLVILLEILIVNLIKIPWGRPRMRLIANDPRAYFMPWWQAGGELKNTLIAAGTAAEEFKSFPSGHVANAAVSIMMGFLPILNKKLADKKTLLVGIGFGWTSLVAASRIVMGAHFLTDTVIGFAVSLTVMLLVSKAVLIRPIGEIVSPEQKMVS